MLLSAQRSGSPISIWQREKRGQGKTGSECDFPRNSSEIPLGPQFLFIDSHFASADPVGQGAACWPHRHGFPSAHSRIMAVKPAQSRISHVDRGLCGLSWIPISK
jgi:hypothetical protein